MTDTQAASFGLLIMYAEDMYSLAVGSLAPPPDSRIAAAGWTVVNYLTAQDALFPSKTAARQRLSANPVKRVFFGFLARNNTDPTSYVAVVRGTDGFVEWVVDAEFLLIPHPRHAGAHVEQGFWSIYQTMSLADPVTGVTTHQNAAEGVEKVVGAKGTVVVMGHSLGSALATYFADDLADRLGPNLSACLFASPRTGDAAWAALFARTVKAYQLFNYIIDIVTHVPTLGYETLPNATVLQPSTAQAAIRFDIFCNHHVICYCAMIDYQDTMATPTTAQDTSCKACILSPPAVDKSAEALATIVNAFGVGDERALAMLKALHTASTA